MTRWLCSENVPDYMALPILLMPLYVAPEARQ